MSLITSRLRGGWPSATLPDAYDPAERSGLCAAKKLAGGAVQLGPTGGGGHE